MSKVHELRDKLKIMRILFKHIKANSESSVGKGASDFLIESVVKCLGESCEIENEIIILNNKIIDLEKSKKKKQKPVMYFFK